MKNPALECSGADRRLRCDTPAQISRHLGALCSAGAVSSWRRQGQTRYSAQGRLAEWLCKAALDGLLPETANRSDPIGGRDGWSFLRDQEPS